MGSFLRIRRKMIMLIHVDTCRSEENEGQCKAQTLELVRSLK